MKYLSHRTIRSSFLLIALFLAVASNTVSAQDVPVLLKQVNLINGMGQPVQRNVDVLLNGGNISAIQAAMTKIPDNTRVIDMKGKTIIPSLISTHVHVGGLKGNAVSPDNYTRENVIRQLEHYEDYGVGTVLSLGTDDKPMFLLRDSSEEGKLPGARVYSAAYGIGVPGGSQGTYKPATPEEAINYVKELVKLKPTVIKIWVDDFHGSSPKMKPEVYKAIISEAHRNNVRVASHLYYLEDARQLVTAGVDIIAHSIRDKDVDPAFIKLIREKGTIYVPTLTLDEFAYMYSRQPEWINDEFFRKSLEPGVYEMITSEEYRKKMQDDPLLKVKEAALATALRNVKKLFDAGVLICLGTDSGAFPIRTQGFSEHLEMELMVQAGLSPLQAITIATRNGARLLRIDRQLGTLQAGKKADFVVLDGNPLENIKLTRSISSVWKDGREVSKGPL